MSCRRRESPIVQNIDFTKKKGAILRIFLAVAAGRVVRRPSNTNAAFTRHAPENSQKWGNFNCRGELPSIFFFLVKLTFCTKSAGVHRASCSRSKQSKLTHFLLPDQWGVVLRLLLLFHFLLLVKINLCALLQQPRGQHYLLRHQPRVHISGRGSGHDGLNLKRQQRGWTSNAPRLQSRRFWSCTPHYLGLRPRKFRPSWQWLLGHWAIGVGPNARHQ